MVFLVSEDVVRRLRLIVDEASVDEVTIGSLLVTVGAISVEVELLDRFFVCELDPAEGSVDTVAGVAVAPQETIESPAP